MKESADAGTRASDEIEEPRELSLFSLAVMADGKGQRCAGREGGLSGEKRKAVPGDINR